MDASVIIPNYNGERYLAACLDSLMRQQRPAKEVIVVDNGSRDESCLLARKHPLKPRVICLQENRGFAFAVNQGIRASSSEVIALLNNDAMADPCWLQAGLCCLEEHPQASVIASLILFARDRSLVDNAGDVLAWDGRPRARGRGKHASNYGLITEVLSACAAAAFYRRKLFEDTGLFKEDFFAYLEDLDLGLRARRRGHVCLFCPEAIVYHQGAATDLEDRPGPKPVDSSERVFLIARNRLRVLARNFPGPYLLFWSPALFAGLGRSLLYHLFFSGQGRAFVRGILAGVQTWPHDRKFYRASESSLPFAPLASILRKGAQEWMSPSR